jgi:hypothetical protein
MTAAMQLADEAAEGIRALNHATLPAAGGLVFPADAYAVTGSLAVLAARLPQVLSQIEVFLADELAAGRIVIVAGEHAGDPTAAITLAAAWLQGARVAAHHLRHALDGAQAALTWAGAADAPR